MISALLGLILFLVILGVIVWGVLQILALVPLAEPFKTIVHVLIVVVGVIICIYVVIWLLGLAGVHVDMPAIGR